MPNPVLKYGFIFLFMLLFSCEYQDSDFEVYGLNQTQSFHAGDKTSTAFSWKIKAGKNNWQQGAYQIIVSGSGKKLENNTGDYWDSGKIMDDSQLFIPYNGKVFANGEKYYWKVRVWEKDRNSSRWSKPQSFMTSLSSPGDWKAKWITYDYRKEASMPLFRKSFKVKDTEDIKSVRLYICGLGYYEAYINGSKIGNRVLEPAQTNYDDYAFYSVYDIPAKKIEKENALGIMLGNGWYNQHVVWSPAMAYGQPLVIAQLVIQYKNGRADRICTDETWKWINGPITFNNIYAGENYDANAEIPGWCSATVNEKDWKPVKPAGSFPPRLVEQFMEPIRRMAELPTVRILEPSAKTWVFDFGQNFAGWVRLKIKGEKGRQITLRYSEEIDRDQNIDPASTGVRATKVVQTDRYTCKGKGTEVWEPRFTYHGFRYVEVTGLDSKPDQGLLTGIVAYSSMKNTGSFKCSEPQINILHDLAVWTIKSNVHGIPTDCPHRERCGWTGDAHTMATALIRNFDARLFLTKYLYDMRSSGRLEKKELYFGDNFNDRSIAVKPPGIPTMIVPGKRTSGIASPDWGTAAVQIPWLIHQYYGDINILREFYPDMKAWVDYVSNKFPGYIVSHGLGDWCPPGGNEKIDCPVSLSSTAFHYLDLDILVKTAYLLGYTSDVAFYTERLHGVKERFNEQFFDTQGNTYRSQTANAMAIQLGVVPQGKTSEVVKSLVRDIAHKSNGFIQTGIFGLGRIFPALAENGAEEFAYDLFTKKGIHSFAYLWEKYNATTLWEILPVDDLLSHEILNKRSHSHPMNAGYDEWFYRGIAGIHPDERAPGFKNIVFRPYFTSKLKNAEATYESPYGPVVSKWKWKGKTFIWDVEIPANSSGVLFIPKIGFVKSVSINGNIADSQDLMTDQQYPDFWVYSKITNGKYRVEIK